jgi:hypothetical protein
MEFFTSFFNQSYSINMRRDDEDQLCWAPSKKGFFDVRSFYNALLPHIWRNKAPLRVVFFAWSAALGMITLDNLRKQHIIVVDWCKKRKETVDHLLLHCPITSALWNLYPLSLFFGLVWIMPCKVMDFLACWRGQLGCPQSEVIWKMIPSCLMRYIWRDKLLKL